ALWPRAREGFLPAVKTKEAGDRQGTWDRCFKATGSAGVVSSCGGCRSMNQRETEVKEKVCAVALTDSAHNIWLQETSKGTQDWMQQHCCNWVSSPEPVDTLLDPILRDCPRVSAGDCDYANLKRVWKAQSVVFSSPLH
ncbi:hypothetical protein JOQ06_012361, partial [Pogonophryne albipinna]